MNAEQGGGTRSFGPRVGGRGETRRPLTVLVVDPDNQRAQQLAELLRPTCLVAIAPSVEVANSIIAARCPDLLICDLELPDMAGAEFLAKLHATPATRNVLLMVVTRRQGIHDKIAALRAGADEYLIWPCEPEFFIQRVKLLSHFRRIF
jgi:DNA-binding response OmpR family regulator